MLFAVHEPSWPWSYTGGMCERRLTLPRQAFAGSHRQQEVAHVGMIRPPAEALLRPYCETRR